MKTYMRMTWLASLVLTLAVWITIRGAGTVAASPSDSGKIPITTRSEDARNEFIQGRDLSDRLLAHESIPHFEKAIALDPEFASAELALATSSPSPVEFLDHLNKALRLVDKTSDGEKLQILATEAGSNNDVAKQKEYLEKLAEAYPNDERAQYALGNFYFGQQEYRLAVEYTKKASEIAPNYSPAYNILGYSYKQLGDYANAEQALQKYIALIPNDPNPYDSYAELLLKEGKFNDSITQYRKALSIDPDFNASRFGLSADLTYLGKRSDAEQELDMMAKRARNDGELRTALFGLAVVAVDGSSFDKAQQAIDKEYAVAEKKNDALSMAGDLQAKGNIARVARQYDQAKGYFDRAYQTVQDSNLPQAVKANAALVHHFNLGVVAANSRDFVAAKRELEEFRNGANAANNPALVRQSHELAGVIALAQKEFETAISELQQAGQQNAQNLYRLGEAFQSKGDASKANEYFAKVAAFNSLPQLNYAFVRVKAQQMVTGKKA